MRFSQNHSARQPIEIRSKSPSSLCFLVGGAGLIVTFGTCWYYGRKILFHYRISTNLHTLGFPNLHSNNFDRNGTKTNTSSQSKSQAGTHLSETEFFLFKKNHEGSGDLDTDDIDLKDYVLLEGVARASNSNSSIKTKPKSSNSLKLISPLAKVECLSYSLSRIHVYEKVIQSTSSGYFGLARIFNLPKSILSLVTTKPFSNKKDSGAGFGASHERVSGKRSVHEEIVSTETQSCDWYLEVNGHDHHSQSSSSSSQPNTQSHKKIKVKYKIDLKEFRAFSDNMKFMKVADFDELKIFELTTVYDRFESGTSGKGSAGSSGSVFKTVGYKSVERVLCDGDKLLVLGNENTWDIESDTDAGTGTGETGPTLMIDVGAPEGESVFDLRSARVRPFIVSTMTRSQLRRVMDVELLKLAAKSFVGVALGVITTLAAMIYL